MRYYWLHQIELALKERGISAEIRSVSELRRLYPNLPSPLNNAVLEKLAGEAPTANLEDWATVLPKNTDRPSARKSQLSYQEIRDRRSSGESLESIAQSANLSRERIRQICKA